MNTVADQAPPPSRYRCEVEWLGIQIAYNVPGAQEALDALTAAHADRSNTPQEDAA